MTTPSAGPTGLAEAVEREVTRWPGVTAGPHPFGARVFRVGRRELGHLHGDHVVEVPLPRHVRDALVAEGRAVRHEWVPESGWASYYPRGPEDIGAVVALLRLSYDRPWLDDRVSEPEPVQ